jgi:RNA polymerase sigma factor for flagellar operon FliA
MLDHLRASDHAPRGWRQRRRAIDAVRGEIETARGRAATEAEIAAALKVTPMVYRRLTQQLLVVDHRLSSVEALREDGDCDPPSPDRSPLDAVLTREVQAAIRRAVATLPPRERCVVTLAERGLTLKQIGARLGVSESMASRIRTAAFRRLRAHPALAAWRTEAA